jgi:DNA-binding NtrC family response regulator
VLTLPNVPTDHAPSRATVLVIDPEPLYRWFVTESLGGCEVDVKASASIEDAAAYLRDSGRVDLLIADGDLLLGSDQSLRLLRERAGATAWVVLDSDGDLSRHGLGGATVVAKPVDSAAVVSLVSRALRRDVTAH